MVQSSLVKYIREQIRAGYDIDTIKKYLLKYGYGAGQVNEALQFAYPPTEVKHVVHFSKTTIALVVAVVFTIALVVGAVFYFSGGKSQLLDVRISRIDSSVEEDGILYFTVEISNLGKAARYDVPLRYEIYDLRDNLIKFEEETLALETRATSSVDIELSGVGAGNYYLKITASYEGGSAKATSSFSIVGKGEDPGEEPSVPVKRCPSKCDDNNKCTNDYCGEETNYECRYDKVFPCCGNGICENGEDYKSCLEDCEAPRSEGGDIFEGKSVFEIIEIVEGIAKRDKKEAIEHCNSIEQTVYKYRCFTAAAIGAEDENVCENIEDDTSRDGCYKDTAEGTKSSSVCDKIVKDSKRDQCYMSFVTKGDYTNCDKLVNKYLKQSCESLKKLGERK